jgi:hypothetical protein
MAGIRLTLKLTPHGCLTLEESGDAHELETAKQDKIKAQ